VALNGKFSFLRSERMHLIAGCSAGWASIVPQLSSQEAQG
jgi:hypothetical protein